MVRTTPLHDRLAALDDQQLFTHWSGRLSRLRYSHSPRHEYDAVRSAVGVFDSSPLTTLRLTGPDAGEVLGQTLLRDVRTLAPGRAAYVAWCDDRGWVRQDGVVLRRQDDHRDDWLLTSARPALGWFADQVGGRDATVEDVSDDLAVLAVQGPRSRAVLERLAPEVAALRPFDHATVAVAGTAVGSEVLVARTGFTGDLGYELTAPADDAVAVLDAVLEAGAGHGIRPYGEEAMDVLRVEAGLPLVDVEWHDGRLATSDADRVTPEELGLGWMVDPSRGFVGAAALRERRTPRWRTVGVVVDWAHWDQLHRAAGLHPSVLEGRQPGELLLRLPPGDDGGSEVGFTTSLCWSPLLQAHVGLARVRPDLAAPGTVLHQELTLAHHGTSVRVRTTTLPHLDPARRRT